MMKWNIQAKSKAGESIVNIQKILLTNRGISKSEQDKFLHPSLSDIKYAPIGLDGRQLLRAAERILQAIKKKESIIVYTDYDVDGIASGTILWEILYRFGAHVLPHVPHRVDEGYGLSKKGIDHVKKEMNASLIITVDHGVTAHEKIRYARNLGIDVIVVDHHLKPEKKLPCFALIHSTKLCATGVAFLFGQYLYDFLKVKRKTQKKSGIFDAEILQYLDLVSLATIADLVPLRGENRILAKFGLELLNKTKRIGLRALIAESSLRFGEIGEYEIGHVLAPRINALGRLSHALDALRLLCTPNKERARLLASKLSSMNRDRQVMTEESVLHARSVVKAYSSYQKKNGRKMIFLADERYNQGIIGLIAGKLAEEFHLPTIVVSKGLEYSKASARSIRGVNIVETIREAEELLVDVGGHPMAAGFTVETKNLDELEKKLHKLLEKKKPDMREKEIEIDALISLSQVSYDLYDLISKFRPFGNGSPEPIFAVKNLIVERLRLVGKNGNHVKLLLRDPYADLAFVSQIEAIGFGMGANVGDITVGSHVDIAFTVMKNTWNGSSNLQLRLRDVIMSKVIKKTIR
ncbi:single-stranded-DNA-specific exonuclease RecJ [Candidatus Gottesmanbacteria bacterium]|nr:single-stranded-DNA-specific exonuclease RecJ [Candidatus Gottesmanbacteria bacterium]